MKINYIWVFLVRIHELESARLEWVIFQGPKRAKFAKSESYLKEKKIQIKFT